jgi:hypothetical protein
MQNLRREITEIQKRNARVERDKKWEISATRKIFIGILTFLSAFLFLKIAGFENCFFAAFVPTGGFFISTFSLKFLRKIWEKF